MSFHIDIEEVNQYKKNFIKNKQAVDAGLQTVLERLQVPEQTGSIKGEVASAVKQDLKNVHQGIVNGLKNAYETFDEDYYDVLLEKFRSTVNETNDAAILDEDYLQKEKEHLTNFNKDFQEIIKSYDTQYAKINDLIALSTPHNAFGDKVKEAKKKLTDTLTNVHTFERMQVEKEVVSNMTETYIELLNVSIDLAYSSPDFDVLTESSAFSDSMAEYQQAIQAQKQFEAQQRELAEQKRLEEQYAKAHPFETYLKESSEEVAKAWGKAVNYIENLPIDQLVEQYGLPEGFKALGKAEKERILFQMGIIGAAGSLISDTAIGAVSTYNSIENAVDTATLKMAGLKPPKYMEYKMEQDKKALTDTYNLVATEEGRAQLKEGVTKMIGNITQNVKNGDSYAIGGYVFNTATLFIPGAGPAAGVAKMGTTAGKISSSVIKQGKALKAGTIVGSISKSSTEIKAGIIKGSKKIKETKDKMSKFSKDLGKDISNDSKYLAQKVLNPNEQVSVANFGNMKIPSSDKKTHTYLAKTKETIVKSKQKGKVATQDKDFSRKPPSKEAVNNVKTYTVYDDGKIKNSKGQFASIDKVIDELNDDTAIVRYVQSHAEHAKELNLSELMDIITTKSSITSSDNSNLEYGRDLNDNAYIKTKNRTFVVYKNRFDKDYKSGIVFVADKKMYKENILGSYDKTGNIIYKEVQVKLNGNFISPLELKTKDLSNSYQSMKEFKDVVKDTNEYLNRNKNHSILNAKLAGNYHPISGVKFDELGYPDFTEEVRVRFTMPSDLKEQDLNNKKELTLHLREYLENNPKEKKIFSEEQIKNIRELKEIQNLKWDKDKNGNIILTTKDLFFTAHLDKKFYLEKDTVQFKECTKQLKKMLKNKSLSEELFTEKQLIDIYNEKERISGLTWHHHQVSGKMELVNADTHSLTGHLGGNALWGKDIRYKKDLELYNKEFDLNDTQSI